MALDGLRAYLQLASGLTEVTRERARTAARALITQGEAVVSGPKQQVSVLAEDLLASSKANRALLLGLVRAEVERSVARLGLVSSAELQAATSRAESLDDRVRELERELRAVQVSTGTKRAPGRPPAGTTKRSTAPVAKKAASKAAAGTSTPVAEAVAAPNAPAAARKRAPRKRAPAVDAAPAATSRKNATRKASGGPRKSSGAGTAGTT